MKRNYKLFPKPIFQAFQSKYKAITYLHPKCPNCKIRSETKNSHNYTNLYNEPLWACIPCSFQFTPFSYKPFNREDFKPWKLLYAAHLFSYFREDLRPWLLVFALKESEETCTLMLESLKNFHKTLFGDNLGTGQKQMQILLSDEFSYLASIYEVFSGKY